VRFLSGLLRAYFGVIEGLLREKKRVFCFLDHKYLGVCVLSGIGLMDLQFSDSGRSRHSPYSRVYVAQGSSLLGLSSLGNSSVRDLIATRYDASA